MWMIAVMWIIFRIFDVLWCVFTYLGYQHSQQVGLKILHSSPTSVDPERESIEALEEDFRWGCP